MRSGSYSAKCPSASAPVLNRLDFPPLSLDIARRKAYYNEEEEGKVNVILSVKNGDKDPPKEVLSFYTDSVLGENKVYNAEVGDVVNSSQNKEATR